MRERERERERAEYPTPYILGALVIVWWPDHNN